jgi:hypothetical protein
MDNLHRDYQKQLEQQQRQQQFGQQSLVLTAAPPTPLYNPGSPSSTPGQNIMTNPSPSMAARHPPNYMNAQMLQDLNVEFQKIPAALLGSIKQEIGLLDKDTNSFSPEDKQRAIHIWYSRRECRHCNPASADPSSGLFGNSQQQVGGVGGGDALGTTLFNAGFIRSMAADEFDAGFLRSDGGDINFERDFAQWFNPDEMPLDLK